MAISYIYAKIYIYIIYTPNLGLEIAVFVREKEQGRFRGSSEGARGSTGGAGGSTGGAGGSTGGAGGSSKRGRILFGLLMYIDYNYFADDVCISTKAVA